MVDCDELVNYYQNEDIQIDINMYRLKIIGYILGWSHNMRVNALGCKKIWSLKREADSQTITAHSI